MITLDEAAIRTAIRMRGEGNLPGAIATLGNVVDPRDPDGHLIYLRVLFDLQDYAKLQQATIRGLAALDADLAATAGADYLCTLLHFAERGCLPVEAIEAALGLTAAAARREADLLVAWRAVRHRQRQRRKLAERYVGQASLISLGLNCLPWQLPGRWGMREISDFTDLFGPFSLAGHTIPGVIAALEDDFATLLHTGDNPCSDDDTRPQIRVPPRSRRLLES